MKITAEMLIDENRRWTAMLLLSPLARVAYAEAAASAQAAYNNTVAPAQAVYVQVVAPAQAVYEKALVRAFYEASKMED